MGGGGKFLKRSESQIQSATLVELNNCIAQFEKFSYFSDESLRMEKDVKFSEISNKLVGFFYRILSQVVIFSQKKRNKDSRLFSQVYSVQILI